MENEYPSHIVEFYYDTELKASVSVKASRTEIALIIALNKLINSTTTSLVNNYIMYNINNKRVYKGEF